MILSHLRERCSCRRGAAGALPERGAVGSFAQIGLNACASVCQVHPSSAHVRAAVSTLFLERFAVVLPWLFHESAPAPGAAPRERNGPPGGGPSFGIPSSWAVWRDGEVAVTLMRSGRNPALMLATTCWSVSKTCCFTEEGTRSAAPRGNHCRTFFAMSCRLRRSPTGHPSIAPR